MGWLNSNWQYRKKITIDKTKVSADLTDFPVYLDLANLGNDFHANVKSDGGDIRITKSNGTTEVPVEIVAIDTSAKTGEVHFKADGTLSSSADTEFYIYYGNSSATKPAIDATYGAENVWDSNYTMVHHFTGSSYTALDDSTSYDNDVSTENGSPTYNATGKVGQALELDGISDYLATGDDFGLSGDFNGTIEAWVEPDNATQAGVVFVGGAYGIRTTFALFLWNDGTPMVAYNGGNNWRTATTYGTDWQHYQISKTPGAINTKTIVHRNGVKLTAAGTSSTNTPNYTKDISQIGEWTTAGYLYDGKIDELRISKTARSDDWSKVCYNNQNSPSTFSTIGSQETNVVLFIPSLIFIE